MPYIRGTVLTRQPLVVVITCVAATVTHEHVHGGGGVALKVFRPANYLDQRATHPGICPTWAGATGTVK